MSQPRDAATGYDQLPLADLLEVTAALNARAAQVVPPAPGEPFDPDRYWDGYLDGVTARRAHAPVPALPAEADFYTIGWRAGYGEPVACPDARGAYPVGLAAADLRALAAWTERGAERAALAEIAQVERLLGGGAWAHAARARVYAGGADD